MKILLNLSCVFFLLLASCASTGQRMQYEVRCHTINSDIDLTDEVRTLGQISDFFSEGCFQTVIQVGGDLRQMRHDKTYELSREALEIFTPEGSQTPYTLESHERTFLSLLIASSYYQLGKIEEAQVEMRKAYEVSQALIYNHGDDLVLTLLQATMWEKLGEMNYAEPMWRRSLQLAPKKSSEREFIKSRLQAIEKGLPSGAWTVYAFDRFPKLDWEMNLSSKNGSFYDLQTTSPFVPSCANEKTLVIPTSTWLRKIEKRYAQDYHPLLNLKSWVRLPVALGYGIITGIAGAGVGFGGCYFAASASDGKGAGDLCGLSLQAGMAIASQAPKLVDYTLRPDLRHWDSAPGGFVITTKQSLDARSDSCGWLFEASPNPLQKVF